jgi:DUF4097 and DUF4098 domain-containing protein YvlB
MPWGEQVSHEESLIVPMPAGRSIKIYNANGKTRVLGEDRDDIEIRIHKSVRADCEDLATKLLDSIRIQNSATTDVLEIEVQIPRKCSRHAIAHIELLVPRDTTISLTSTNGKMHLEGLERAVHARSSNGPVLIRNVKGDIDVMTANAKVKCADTQGHLRARSSNGKIEVECHCGSLDASTSNGVIRASIDQLDSVGVTLTTSNGRIVLDLPEKTDADIDIRVENGHIRNDLEMMDQTRDNDGRVRGRIGRGGTPIRLRTSNGTVSLR